MVETATIILVIVEDPWTFGYKLHVYRQIRRPTVAIKSQNANQSRSFQTILKWKVQTKNQKSVHELRSRLKKSIFNLKSQNQKSKVDFWPKKSLKKVNVQLEKSKSNIHFWSAKIYFRLLTFDFDRLPPIPPS